MVDTYATLSAISDNVINKFNGKTNVANVRLKL